MMSRVEELIQELATVGDVKISLLGERTAWFVSAFPRDRGPLWWFGRKATLKESLVEFRKKAVKYRFLETG